MIRIKEYVIPYNLEDAYKILTLKKNNVILGGCGFLKLGSKNINTAIDLKNINLSYIKENENEILIGADTSLRDVEINNIIKEYADGIISNAISNIVGVQFRNNARIGASVFSKYGFSDLIPALLVLNCKVNLYKQGILSLEEFLKQKHQKDILVDIIIPKQEGRGVFTSIRKCSGDFPILNGAMFKSIEQEYIISIGARPQKAMIPQEACIILNNENDIEKAAKKACEELSFGSNIRGSKEYRKDMCKSLIIRMYKNLDGDAYGK